MFNFEEASKILEQDEITDLVSEKKDFSYFSKKAELLEIKNKTEALEAVSMACQARKIRQSLEKTRKEILKPYLDYQSEITKNSFVFQENLENIEKSLIDKISNWIEEDSLNSFAEEKKLEVEDGTYYSKNTWKCDILDIACVPTQYLLLDEKEVKKAINSGVRIIPGLSIYEIEEKTLKIKN